MGDSDGSSTGNIDDHTTGPRTSPFAVELDSAIHVALEVTAAGGDACVVVVGPSTMLQAEFALEPCQELIQQLPESMSRVMKSRWERIRSLGRGKAAAWHSDLDVATIALSGGGGELQYRVDQSGEDVVGAASKTGDGELRLEVEQWLFEGHHMSSRFSLFVLMPPSTEAMGVYGRYLGVAAGVVDGGIGPLRGVEDEGTFVRVVSVSRESLIPPLGPIDLQSTDFSPTMAAAMLSEGARALANAASSRTVRIDRQHPLEERPEEEEEEDEIGKREAKGTVNDDEFQEEGKTEKEDVVEGEDTKEGENADDDVHSMSDALERLEREKEELQRRIGEQEERLSLATVREAEMVERNKELRSELGGRLKELQMEKRRTLATLEQVSVLRRELETRLPRIDEDRGGEEEKEERFGKSGGKQRSRGRDDVERGVLLDEIESLRSRVIALSRERDDLQIEVHIQRRAASAAADALQQGYAAWRSGPPGAAVGHPLGSSAATTTTTTTPDDRVLAELRSLREQLHSIQSTPHPAPSTAAPPSISSDTERQLRSRIAELETALEQERNRPKTSPASSPDPKAIQEIEDRYKQQLRDKDETIQHLQSDIERNKQTIRELEQLPTRLSPDADEDTLLRKLQESEKSQVEALSRATVLQGELDNYKAFMERTMQKQKRDRKKKN